MVNQWDHLALSILEGTTTITHQQCLSFPPPKGHTSMKKGKNADVYVAILYLD
jgi:hypothetical protein